MQRFVIDVFSNEDGSLRCNSKLEIREDGSDPDWIVAAAHLVAVCAETNGISPEGMCIAPMKTFSECPGPKPIRTGERNG